MNPNIVKRIMPVMLDRQGEETADPREFDRWQLREVEFDVETGERA